MNRLDFLKSAQYFVEKGWGSYKELIEMTMKDFIEIKIAIESNANEDKLEQSLADAKKI